MINFHFFFFVAVHDVSGLVENAAESDSEDEWNYIKGDDANKENISPQPEKEVSRYKFLTLQIATKLVWCKTF